MCASYFFGSVRGYSEILLEEIALEGLDGITLEILWKRLEHNPDWKLKNIDNLIEKFVWKHLVALKNVQWFELKEPKACPPIFATLGEFLEAAEKNVIDLNTVSKHAYPHYFINDGKNIGSCPSYNDRIEVTEEVQQMSLMQSKEKWGNKLVIVADQAVRYAMLLPSDLNPEFELHATAYCILERIGRSRRCGELASALTFLKNGANPIFYFWNNLKKQKIIMAQSISLGGKITYSTLFHLPRFHQKISSEVKTAITNIVNYLKTYPKKRCLFSEVKELYFINKPKFTKTETFRRYLKTSYIPYREYFPDSDEALWTTQNKSEKLVRILTLVNENVDPSKSSDDSSDDENENQKGILRGSRLFNKPLISQCYHLIDETKYNGITMKQIGLKLGLNKLVTRQMTRNLIKLDLIDSVSSENARKRFYTYYSKNYVGEVKMKLQEQLNRPFEIANKNSLTALSESNISCESVEKTLEDEDNTMKCINNSTRKAVKRPLSQKENSTGAKRMKNNSLEPSEVSSPAVDMKQNEIGTKTISCIEHVIPANESMFVIRRINIVLEYVYKYQVAQRTHLSRIILEEERKRGISQGFPDRKSLRKVINILLKSGKVKILKQTVKNEDLDKTKEVEFLCMPSVNEGHPAIQTAMQQTKNDLSILYIKDSMGKKKLPNALPNTRARTTTACQRFAPKFARMKIMHELLVYILYHYQGDENLNDEECKNYIKAAYPDLDSNEPLPKCYLKEISWKMFIPPLMKYEEYNDGWISQNDIAERIPLKLFFSLLRLPIYNPEIDQYLNHPIRQYYLIRHLPQNLQQYVTVDKRYLYLLFLTIRNLCTIGLVQLGPKGNIRGNTNLVFLNKRTELLDTRSCPPGHLKINPNLNYPLYFYDFATSKSIETYWNDAMRFCIGTKLGHRNLASETPRKRCKNMPDRLLESLKTRKIEEAPLLDNGKVPGDHLGAVGFDSWHFSHFIKSWFNSQTDKIKKPTIVIPTSTKQSKISLPCISKIKRLRRHTMNRKTTAPVKRIRTKSVTFDKADVEALKKLRTLRASWVMSEDDVLLMCYAASKFYIHPSFPTYKPYKLFRKLLHENSQKSLDKTAEACKRRLANLVKNPLKNHSIELFVKDMLEDEKLKEECQPIIEEMLQCTTDKDLNSVYLLLEKLTEKVFYYLRSNAKESSVLTGGTYDSKLPDDIETFRKNWNYEYAKIIQTKKSLPLNSEKDGSVLSICNLIFSTLLSQVDKAKTPDVNFLLTVFKQFEEAQLKTALSYVRNNRQISFNKSNERQRSCYLPFGKGVYHLSISYHTILKNVYNSAVFGQVYSKYLEMVSSSDREHEVNHYDAGLNLLLISYFVFNKINFQLSIPESILCFNSVPPTYVAPEKMLKPIIVAKESFTDMTLSIIRESFFDNKSKVKESTVKKNRGNEVEHEMSDSDSFADDDYDEDEKLIDYSSSKIAIFLTRNQFKQSEIRFSNAYDNFLINTYPMNYCLVKGENNDPLFIASRVSFLKTLEDSFIYTKIKYTSDEVMLKVRKCLRNPIHRDFAINVLEFLRMKGALGATYEILRKEFNDLLLLKKVIETLYRKKIIIRCGSQHTHFIHMDFADHWLIRSWKNKNIFSDENYFSSQSPTIINRNKCEAFESTNTEQEIWISMKPWVYVNGTINEPALDCLLIRVLSFILKKPGVSLKHAQNRFIPSLLPHCTRELIEILEQLKCVQLKLFTAMHKVSLLSKKVKYSMKELASGFENEDQLILEPDVNALTKFSIFLSSTNYKDLLETKYYTGKLILDFLKLLT